MPRPLRSLALATLPLAALACSDSTGVGGPQNVALNFQVSSGVGALAAPGTPAVGGPLVVVGTNGTLTIDEVRLIVSEVELEKEDDDGCAGDDHGSDDIGDSCEKFNAGPSFLDLPLDGQLIQVTTDLVPTGVYDEFEFEIEDLEDDEDDSVEAALIAAVRAEVLAEIPDWPRKASALVVGSFTPTGGTAIDFRVFVDAEIEVEFELIPDLVIDGGNASRAITVDIVPQAWFMLPGGAVRDLSQDDYDTTGRLLELEVELEDGFTEVEVDD